METPASARRQEGRGKKEAVRDGNAQTDCDELLLEGVDTLEQYLNEQERACAKLKQGFLKLAKARLRLPAHALSELSYHESFEASRVVLLLSDGRWELQSAREAQLEPKGSNYQQVSTLRQRKAGSTSQKTVEAAGSMASLSTAGGNIEPLMWFSSLPPSDLRQAQKQFASGLEALLEAAASARKVQKAVLQTIKAPP